MARVRASIQRGFPRLTTSFQVTSAATPQYNCIAWAAGDLTRWWWPSLIYYWQSNVPRVETLDAFIAAFATLGYQLCSDGEIQSGFEKVAIYAENGVPKHMARQLRTGAWTSKLGPAWDIGHLQPGEVGGRNYGYVVCFLSRRRD
jgi:hypothetical protein